MREKVHIFNNLNSVLLKRKTKAIGIEDKK